MSSCRVVEADCHSRSSASRWLDNAEVGDDCLTIRKCQAAETAGIKAGRLRRPEMKCNSKPITGIWSANPT